MSTKAPLPFDARAAAILLGGQWGKYVIQLVSLAILARLLDPGAFGLLGITAGLVAFASVIGDFGLSLACLQATDFTTQQRTNLSWMNIALGLVLCAALGAASKWISEAYAVPQLESMCQVMALLFVVNGACAQYRVSANRTGHFGRTSLADTVGQALGLVVAVVCAISGVGPLALALQPLVASTTALLSLALTERWVPGLPRRAPGTMKLIRYGASILVIQLVNAASSNIDAVVLGWFHPTSAVGFYNRAQQVSVQPVTQVTSPVTRLAVPKIAQAGENPQARFAAARAVHTPVAFVTAGLLSFVAANGEFAARIVLGPQWSGIGPLISVLALAGCVQVSGYFFYWLLVASGRSAVLLWSELVPRLLIVVAILVFGRLGAETVAWCLVGGQIALLLTGSLYAMPKVGVSRRAALGCCFAGTWPSIVITVAVPWLLRMAEQTPLAEKLPIWLVSLLAWIVLTCIFTLTLPSTRSLWGNLWHHASSILGRRGIPAVGKEVNSE